jgi:hypothetical protein
VVGEVPVRCDSKHLSLNGPQDRCSQGAPTGENRIWKLVIPRPLVWKVPATALDCRQLCRPFLPQSGGGR